VGCYKTNFDGVVFTKTGEAGIGVVNRNSNGEVMSSLLGSLFLIQVGSLFLIHDTKLTIFF